MDGAEHGTPRFAVRSRLASHREVRVTKNRVVSSPDAPPEASTAAKSLPTPGPRGYSPRPCIGRGAIRSKFGVAQTQRPWANAKLAVATFWRRFGFGSSHSLARARVGMPNMPVWQARPERYLRWSPSAHFWAYPPVTAGIKLSSQRKPHREGVQSGVRDYCSPLPCAKGFP